MRNTLETRLGVFFALALIAGVVILELAGTRDLFSKGYPLRARFDNIQELKEGDPVKMAGVEVGHVQKIQLADNKVEVVINVDKKSKVKTDSKAAIKFVGLMGQNYISLTFGSTDAPVASSGLLLESEEQADLNSLMVKLQNVAEGVEGLTKNFSGENFSNLLGPFTDFLKENNPRLSAILGNLQTISTRIAAGEGTIGKLINEDTLYRSALNTVSNLNTTVADARPLFDEMKLTLDQAKGVVTQVNQGQGTIGKLIKDETLYRETTTAMTNLREILQKINQGQGSVGQLVNDPGFINNAKLTLQKVEKATEGLEDQGPLPRDDILRLDFKAFVLVLPDEGGIVIQERRKNFARGRGELFFGLGGGFLEELIVVRHCTHLTFVVVGHGMNVAVFLGPGLDFLPQRLRQIVEFHRGGSAMLAKKAGVQDIACEQRQQRSAATF
jgi:phospholipid/cholesterol/gamma-HCH transport system substrate-binding protein